MNKDKTTTLLLRQQKFGKRQSVKQSIAEGRKFERSSENMNLLLSCENDWSRLEPLRKERARNIRYKNGDQWGDYIRDPDTGKWIREDEYLSSTGKVPLKHNFIQQFVRNIQGQLLINKTQSTVVARASDDSQLSEMLTNTLHACQELNDIDTINISVLEDLLLGGIACTKVRYTFFSDKNRPDGRIDRVGIERLFFNSDIEDPRMNDLCRIGEIHDYTMTELIHNFAQTKSDEMELQRIYSSVSDSYTSLGGADTTRSKKPSSFLLTNTPDKCRVIEVWERKSEWVTYCHDYATGREYVSEMSVDQIGKINTERIVTGISLGMQPEEIALIYTEPRNQYYWRASFLTPTGECLKQISHSPYAHEEHPYTIITTPMVDGAIKPVMSDLIDLQRYINRLIVLKDFMMSTSAKGVLLLPEESIPDGMTADDFNREWVKPNGVIQYRANVTGNIRPEQISINNADNGTSEMLNLELSLMQQISGLSGAIQGQTTRANTPSSLYAQQAQNSSLNYRVVFEVFNKYISKRDEKLLKVLMQYYTDRRHVDISGSAYTNVAKFYDPQMAQKIIDFNLVVVQSNDTPAYRQISDDTLMEFLRGGLINLEMYLDNSSMPFAEKLKAQLSQQQAQQPLQQAQDIEQ